MLVPAPRPPPCPPPTGGGFLRYCPAGGWGGGLCGRKHGATKAKKTHEGESCTDSQPLRASSCSSWLRAAFHSDGTSRQEVRRRSGTFRWVLAPSGRRR